jgi:hypothetical protein
MSRRAPSVLASVYDHLDERERANVLAALLGERSELRAEVKRLVATLLGDIRVLDDLRDAMHRRAELPGWVTRARLWPTRPCACGRCIPTCDLPSGDPAAAGRSCPVAPPTLFA